VAVGVVVSSLPTRIHLDEGGKDLPCLFGCRKTGKISSPFFPGEGHGLGIAFTPFSFPSSFGDHYYSQAAGGILRVFFHFQGAKSGRKETKLLCRKK